LNPLDSLDVKGLGFRVGSIEWEGEKGRAKCCFCHAMLLFPLHTYSQKLIMKIFSFSICSQIKYFGNGVLGIIGPRARLGILPSGLLEVEQPTNLTYLLILLLPPPSSLQQNIVFPKQVGLVVS
jgi:hypothetical protein